MKRFSWSLFAILLILALVLAAGLPFGAFGYTPVLAQYDPCQGRPLALCLARPVSGGHVFGRGVPLRYGHVLVR